jgi:hypothetical protein
MTPDRVWRLALAVDAAHVAVFVARAAVRAAGPDPRRRWSAVEDAAVGLAGLALAVRAGRRRGWLGPPRRAADETSPGGASAGLHLLAGLVVNTVGASAVLACSSSRVLGRGSRAWTTWLLVGGDVLSVVYLAALARASSASGDAGAATATATATRG